MLINVNGNPYKIETVSDLKYAFEDTGIHPYFFSRKTIRFFGQTMRHFRLSKKLVEVNGEKCFYLTGKNPLTKRTHEYFFSATTLEQVY